MAAQPVPSRPPGERRRSPRNAAAASAWLGPADRGRTRSGDGFVSAVVDLSLHGIGLECDRPVEVGGKHWLLLSRGPMRLSTRVRVVSCRQRDDGRFAVGGEFY